MNGRVVCHRTTQRRPARRGHPALEAGSLLYLIQYPDGSFFRNGYVPQSSAKKVMANLTGDDQERAFNSTRDPEHVLQTWTDPTNIY